MAQLRGHAAVSCDVLAWASRDPELLTIVEAAELLRAPIATLRYWRHLGTGPGSFRLGRRVLHRRDDLYAWIDQQSTEAAAGHR